MRRRPYSTPCVWARCLCIPLVALPASPATAATASVSQVIPSNITPPLRQTQPEPDARALPASPDAPANADGLTVTIGKLTVLDGYPALADLVRVEAAKVEGRKVSMRTLYDTAARIEAIYVANGHLLARASVPAQHVDDGGPFVIRIVHGFIETIEIDGLDPKTRALVEARLHDLVGADDVTTDRIERRLLLAGDIPGLTLKSALAPGDKPGGTRLVLQAAVKRVSLTAGIDNDVADRFSGVELRAQALFSNTLGAGELIYGSLFNGPHADDLFAARPERRIVGVGLVLPIGNDGLSFNPELIAADIHPQERAGVLVRTGRFARASFKLSYPVVRSRRTNLILTGALEAVQERQLAEEFGTTLSHDRLRLLSLAIDWTRQPGPRTRIASHIELVRGLTGFGARTLADVAASNVGFSRLGTQPDYARIGVDLRLRHQSRGGVTFSTTIQAQKTLTGALPSYGQLGLDGRDGLSTFTPGTSSVDTGVVARGEVGFAPAFGVAPYLFGSAGFGRLANPTSLEKRDVQGGSFGIGVRSTVFRSVAGPAVDLDFELSHGASTFAAGARDRAFFALSLRY